MCVRSEPGERPKLAEIFLRLDYSSLDPPAEWPPPPTSDSSSSTPDSSPRLLQLSPQLELPPQLELSPQLEPPPQLQLPPLVTVLAPPDPPPPHTPRIFIFVPEFPHLSHPSPRGVATVLPSHPHDPPPTRFHQVSELPVSGIDMITPSQDQPELQWRVVTPEMMKRYYGVKKGRKP
jgi:hypothetical protein